jgi:hypothetical protein
MNKNNLQVVRESFGKVVYTHKTHEKDAEIWSCRSHLIKWINIFLTALTSGTLVSTFFNDQSVLIYISSGLSFLVLFFLIFQISFRPEEMVEKHKNIAKELWYIKEKYLSLISDIMSESITDEEAIERRDYLINEIRMIYKFSPGTTSGAYKKARKVLKIDEESTFSDEEIDMFLPTELKQKAE